LQQADGRPLLLASSAAPLTDAEGRIVGTRGMGVDWSEYDDGSARLAASLRRGEVLDHILWRMGGEVLAPRMMQAALDALVNAIGAEGAAVIDVDGEAGALPVPRGGADEVLAEATALLAVADGRGCLRQGWTPILVATCRAVGANAGIALWRSPGSRVGTARKAADRCLRQPDPHGAGA
jgi:hypothetical protein